MIIGYCDGLCEPKNPEGIVAYGFYIVINNQIIYKEAKVIGEGKGMSNNVGEYVGLINMLKYLINNNYTNEEIIIKSDSMLLVNQMNELWGCRGGYYVKYYLEAKELKSKFKNIKFVWIPREQNYIADLLSREAYEKYCRERKYEVKYMRKE